MWVLDHLVPSTMFNFSVEKNKHICVLERENRIERASDYRGWGVKGETRRAAGAGRTRDAVVKFG